MSNPTIPRLYHPFTRTGVLSRRLWIPQHSETLASLAKQRNACGPSQAFLCSMLRGAVDIPVPSWYCPIPGRPNRVATWQSVTRRLLLVKCSRHSAEAISEKNLPKQGGDLRDLGQGIDKALVVWYAFLAST